ncbi:MscS Mechanosensitive ion channel [[Leptolyngbya] sp. PCC 7376]|uniref:mechanosensitive ion channel domain-containing protein n=1 Tax=[Leptolyngbya] sp. PCC 7376 TaxID=111781 RepID=UPI00029ED175|nr:mechanosensitive ion channel domain-containing protein [[Leptolyngbya] sp. PCC 7376]AFY40095.1 MscS Mechanosensitive ion channel [[Leptolyngbya] sp. PCC 7376]
MKFAKQQSTLKQKLKVIIATSIMVSSFCLGLPLKAQEEEVGATPLTTTIVGEPETEQAITAENSEIPLDQLKFLVQPLLLEELEVEAAAWLMLLKAKVQEKADAEIAIKRRNEITDTKEEAVESIETAEKLLEQAQQAKENAEVGTPEYDNAIKKVEEAEAALAEARAAVTEVIEAQEELQEDEASQKAIEKAEEIVEEKEAEESGETPPPSDDNSEAIEVDKESLETLGEAQETLDEIAEEEKDEAELLQDDAKLEEEEEILQEIAEDIEDSAEEEAELKQELVKGVTELQEEQTAIADRLEVVLDEMDAKGGDSTSYRTYIKAVSTLEIDVTDTSGLGVRIQGWLASEEGGLRWAKNIAVFLVVLAISVAITQALAVALDKSLKKFGNTSNLLREFSVMTVKRGGIVLGILLGLTALEVSLGPVLALVGGASFILAFALQSNLGNFASGLLLLTTKPFDVGDEIQVAGYWAFVRSITLANTKLQGFDGSIITIPNNTVWGGNIVNHTHSDMRKLTLNINVKFVDDLEKVKNMWFEIASDEPRVERHYWFPYNSHFDSHVSITLGSWTKTEEYWEMYIVMLLKLQKRLDELNIELTTPIQDIRIQQLSSGTTNSETLNPSQMIPPAE